MKKVIIYAIMALFALQTAYAQEPNARYKLLRYEWTVNDDGTSDFHYRHEVTILRNSALTAYAYLGETFVVYNPDLETLKVNEVYTIQKDGTRVEMPENAFIYQLPEECADCGRFNHMRELAMVHTGMEIGCTVVVDYTIHRQFDLLHKTLDIIREIPIERFEVNIRVPESQELTAEVINPQVIPFHPNIAQTEHSLILKAVDLPQGFMRDALLPDASRLYPTLRFYNGTPDFKPAFDNRRFTGAKRAMGQVMAMDSERENIVAARDFVVDNIHLNDISPEKLGYTHSTAEETWQSGCGTATDKAVLLAGILNSEGHQARVMGDDMDYVGVMIDTLEYRLDVRHKAPIEIAGEAKDEVQTFAKEDEVSVLRLDTLEGGFYRLDFGPIMGDPANVAPMLAPSRKAPLAAQACDLRTKTTYTLPKGMKMVGKAIEKTLDYPGVGSLKVSIKQSGKKLVVVRNLKVEKSFIQAPDYANYRSLIVNWNESKSVLLRTK